MIYRNRAALDLAHDMHECTIGVPGVCVGYAVEGCEPAHGGQALGKGMGIKAGDVFAAACHACHAEIDQGKLLTKGEKESYIHRGMARTWLALMRSGRLVVR